MTQTLSRAGATSVPRTTNPTFEVKFGDGRDDTFYPLQYHLHAPSEHSINGKLMDLELHIVHVDAQGTPAAVIGFLFQVSNDGDATNVALDGLLPRNYNSTSATAELNLGRFLETVDISEFYNYDGSFTTPPCTEGINWFVVKDVQKISQAQL